MSTKNGALEIFNVQLILRTVWMTLNRNCITGVFPRKKLPSRCWKLPVNSTMLTGVGWFRSILIWTCGHLSGGSTWVQRTKQCFWPKNMNPLNFWIGGYRLSVRVFRWSFRMPRRQKKHILRSTIYIGGLVSGLSLLFLWSRARSRCSLSAIPNGTSSRPVCCGFWPMCCLHRTTNRKCWIGSRWRIFLLRFKAARTSMSVCLANWASVRPKVFWKKLTLVLRESVDWFLTCWSPVKMPFHRRRSLKHSGRMIQTIQPRMSKGWFTVCARSSALFQMSHWFYPLHPDISSTRSFTLWRIISVLTNLYLLLSGRPL